MNSYFERLELDSIALESAIGAFEAENDITDEYLHDYSDYDEEPAYESASASSDSFGFDLFEDMYAPATEEADTANAGSKGSKLSQGIKNILASIGKLFVKIKDGIVNFFESFKKKKAQVNAEKVKANASPAAIDLANDMRGSIKQAFKIITNVTTADHQFIAKLCTQINAALKKVGGSGAILKSQSSKLNEYNPGANTDKFAAAGKALRTNGNYGDDSENSANAQKALADAEAILDNVQKTNDELNKAIENVHNIFEKEFTAAWNKLKNSKDATAVHETDVLSRAAMNNSADKAKADAEKAKADQKEIDKFNASARRRNDVEGGHYAVKSTAAISMATLLNQVRQIVFVDYDVSALNAAIKGVIDACKDHADNCDKIMNIVPDTLTGDAKIGYDMCKVLSRSSRIYTQISAAIQKLTSGDVFNVKLSDGTTSDKYNLKGNWESRQSGEDRGVSKRYLDE